MKSVSFLSRYGLLILAGLAVVAYVYFSPVDKSDAPPSNVSAENERTFKTPDEDNTAAALQTLPTSSQSQKTLDLNELVSPDSDIRRKALVALGYEFAATPPRSEGRYSTYGDELLPYLQRVINDLDDPYSHHAVKAVFHMSFINQVRLLEKSTTLDPHVVSSLESLSHYPIPSNYEPMKDALASVVTNSKNRDARDWAAMALAHGFEPAEEVEELLARRLPIEEEWEVQLAILNGLSAIGDRNPFQDVTKRAIVASLASSNLMTQRSAAELIARHKFDGGLDGLIGNIPAVRDTRTLKTILNSVVSFGRVDEKNIAELERIASQTTQVDRKNEILSTIETLRNVTAR